MKENELLKLRTRIRKSLEPLPWLIRAQRKTSDSNKQIWRQTLKIQANQPSFQFHNNIFLFRMLLQLAAAPLLLQQTYERRDPQLTLPTKRISRLPKAFLQQPLSLQFPNKVYNPLLYNLLILESSEMQEY